MITEKIIRVLEFNRVLQAAAAFTILPGSAEKLCAEVPSTVYADCKKLLELTREADIALSEYNLSPIYEYGEVISVIKKAEKMSLLSVGEIVRAGTLLRSGRIFKSALTEAESDSLVQLKAIASLIYTDEGLEKEISRCFVSEDTVSDNATEKLYHIRKKMREASEDIKEKLRGYVRGAEYKKYIQDALITVRSGRYVIPIKQEYKNQVPGMLHDRSDTGSTVYIEPAAVVELNNEIRLLQIAERQEIEAILRDFTARISAISAQLEYNTQNLCDADVAFAKAKYGYSVKGIYPQLRSDGCVDIIRGRHPLIDPAKIVPVDVSFGKDYNILIITGPNTGGKTVTLKLCGLFSLMAMSGMYLPAGDGTEISVFDGIFADIGDEQSIEHSLSTFSSHIKNIVDITRNVTSDSLVLLDELGVGTDPAEGSALALALLERLSGTGCKGIVTTHYGEVKEYAFAAPKLKNASMEFDPVKLTPTYRLNIGMPGSSSALEISQKLGLDRGIIDRAYSFLSQEKIDFDRLIKSAEAARAEANNKLIQAEQLRADAELSARGLDEERRRYTKLTEDFEKSAKQQLKKVYSDAAYKSGELLRQLDEIIRQSELKEYDIVRAKQIKNRLEDEYYSIVPGGQSQPTKRLKAISAESLKEGMRVFVRSVSQEAHIVKLDKNRKTAIVSVGMAQLSVPCTELFLPEKPAAKAARGQMSGALDNGGGKAPNIAAAVTVSRAAGTVSGELKLLGKTVLEAQPLIDEFIDCCAVSGLKECKIIHGTGTGALRKGVREYLKLHPLVKSFRGGRYGEGESGVTVAELY